LRIYGGTFFYELTNKTICGTFFNKSVKLKELIMIRKIFCILALLAMSETHPMDDKSKPPSLENIGNSCFINAVLQVLLNMDRVAVVIKANREFYRCGSLAQKFQDMVFTLNHSSSYTPEAFAKQVWDSLAELHFTQQDAEQFLLTFLSKLAYSDITPPMRDSHHALELAKLVSFRLHFSDTARREPACMLSLPMHHRDVSLHQCMRHFFAGDSNSQASALQRGCALTSNPYYLILGLKRNYYSILEEKLGKHGEPITFPLEGLTLKDYLLDPSRPAPEYELVSFVTHAGSPTSGHYTAYVRKAVRWYHCNDESIRSLDTGEIESIALNGYAGKAVPTLFVYEQTTGAPRPRATTYSAAAAAAAAPAREYSLEATQSLIKAITQAAGPNDIAELLARGANPNGYNSDGVTALHLAYAHGSTATAELLIAYGALL
jgi:Ubiquitin carboxyl-terminal hydrolase